MSEIFKNLLSSANTFTANQTIASGSNLTLGGGVVILTNSTLQTNNAGTLVALDMVGNANSAAFNYFGSILMNFDTTSTGLAAYFPSNCGWPFAGTLSPSGATQTVDWTTGTSQKIDSVNTTGTLVLTFSNPTNGGRYILKTLGKTSRIWTFPSSVKWAGGVAPTVTAVTGAKDMFEFYYDAGDSTYVGRIVAQNVS